MPDALVSAAATQAGRRRRALYNPGFAFPAWTVDPAAWNDADFAATRVLHHASDALADVVRVATEREPCNIAMNRLYDEDGMRKAFGWSRGAYADSVPGRPMPNIAVVCRATVQLAKRRVRAWVVNLVGVAHDSRSQPDYKVFTTREQVLAAYRRIWQLGVAAALMLRKEHGVDVLQVYNVGGGAFSGSLFDDFVRECFEPAFLPLLPRLEQAGVRVAGYDVRARRFDGGWIPNVLEDMDNGALARMLWVNAWDPWSLIGNGNARDASLDGFGGRCSNLAVLGWPRTNPHLKYVVAVSGEGEDGHEAHKQEL